MDIDPPDYYWNHIWKVNRMKTELELKRNHYCVVCGRNVGPDHEEKRPGEHKVYHFGAILTKPKAYQYKYAPNVNYGNPNFTLPEKVDLRSVFSDAGFEPFDQGTQGSCTANAGAADKAYMEIISRTYPNAPFSRAFLYYMERKLHGWEDEDTGAQMEDIGTALSRYGICLNSTMPYHEYDFTTPPSTAALEEALLWTTDTGQTRVNVDQIKNFICHTDGTFHPVRIGIPIPQSFLSSQIGGFVPMPKPGEGLLGGHALLAVGYDDALSHGGLTGYYIVLNSWSTLYGDKGYVYIPYKWMDYYANDIDNWQQLDSTPGPGPGPQPQPPNCWNDFWNCVTRARNPLTIFQCVVDGVLCLLQSGASLEEVRAEYARMLDYVEDKLQ